jgi:hypothetical protein
MARRPETIRSGGFQGGQFVQAAQVPQTNSLSQLAESLNVINQQGATLVGGAVESHLKQLETTGTMSGEEMVAKNAGLDTTGWEAQLQDPNVAAVLKNKYAAAVVHKHRGRLKADELAQSAVAAGVDMGDKAAVDAFYRENAPAFEGASKFYTSGFNEQNARHQSQFFQQSIAKNAADIAATTREAATTAFGDILGSGPITAESAAAAFAILKDPAFGNFKGTDATQMQADYAQKLVGEGRVEELKVFLSTKRGDAPALQDSYGIVDDAPTWIAQAERIAEGDQAARDANLKLTLFKAVDDDSKPLMTLDSLESLPQYEQLSDQGKLAAYSHWEASRNQRAARADAMVTKQLLAATRQNVALESARALQSGTGWLVESGQAQDGFEILRNEMFGGRTWDQLTGDDAEALKKYGAMMGKSNHVDDTLSRYLTGAQAYLSPETLKGNEKNLAQVFGVYRILDPNASRRAVKDDRTQSLLDEMDNIARGYPNRPVEQVAVEAVARLNGKGETFSIKPAALRDAVEKSALTLKEKWLWDDTVEMDSNVIVPYLRERTREIWEVNGHNTEAALKTAIEDAKTKAFAPVNGKPVRVPQGEGWTPERFTTGAEEYIRTLDPAGYADWNISPMTGGAYRVSPPSGYEDEYPPIVFENQLAASSATRGARLAAEQKAIDEAKLADRKARAAARSAVRTNPALQPDPFIGQAQ